MKYSIIFIFLLSLFSSCKTKYKYPRFDYNKSTGVNPCITAFKDNVFLSILRECYRGTDAMKEIHKRDVGNPYDGIYGLYEKIDSIGIDFAKRIPPPILCDECTKDQNYYMTQALHFYASYELDSIAKAELKKFSTGCIK